MKNIRNKARQLRRDQTFRRQHPIGPFVADFCCPQQKLIVELDGGQHPEAIAEDEKRVLFLEAQGYRVVRFWNHEVLTNTDGVLERIAEVLGDPHPSLLPGRARVKKAVR